MPNLSSDQRQAIAIRNAILSAENSTSFLRGLIAVKNSLSKTLTLSQFGKALGIPSSGYVSDLMQGNKILNRKYVDALCNVFGLDTFTQTIFELLLERDRKRLKSEKLAVTVRITELREILRERNFAMPELWQERNFACKVFCACDFRPEGLTKEELAAFFEMPPDAEALHRALELLLELRFIKLSKQRYKPIHNKKIFEKSEDGFSHIQFIEGNMADARQNLAALFDKPQEALFQSFILCVQRSSYEEALRNLRTKFYDELIKLHSETGDMILHFNAQVYPVNPATLPKSSPPR